MTADLHFLPTHSRGHSMFNEADFERLWEIAVHRVGPSFFNRDLEPRYSVIDVALCEGRRDMRQKTILAFMTQFSQPTHGRLAKLAAAGQFSLGSLPMEDRKLCAALLAAYSGD